VTTTHSVTGIPSRVAGHLYVAALLLTLSWGLLAFGAVYRWAYTPLALASAVVGTLGFGFGRGQPWAEKALALALLLVAVVTGLQLAPLPIALLSQLSPNAVRFLDSFDLTWAVGTRTMHPLSISPGKTWLGLALFAALALLLLGSARAFGRIGVLAFVRALIVIGAGVALFAIVQAALNAGRLAYEVKIYGFWQPINRATPFGPFVNRNHFAGWMLLVLPIALAYLCGLIERGKRGVPATWRHRILWIGSPEGGRSVLTALAIAVMGLSLLASQSRSGLGSLTLAVIIVGGWMAIRRGGLKRLALPLVVFAAGGGILLAWAGTGVALGRFSTAGSELGTRITAWHDALRIIRDFPVSGTGLNTYGTATLRYQTTSLSAHFQEAHNEYLQIAAEGGILLVVAFALCVWRLMVTIRRRFAAADEPALARWVRLGAVTALIAIALQSLMEFSLQMPGNAALFAVVTALAVHTGAAEPGRRHHGGADRRHQAGLKSRSPKSVRTNDDAPGESTLDPR
jgi:O-antigen ligase